MELAKDNKEKDGEGKEENGNEKGEEGEMGRHCLRDKDVNSDLVFDLVPPCLPDLPGPLAPRLPVHHLRGNTSKESQTVTYGLGCLKMPVNLIVVVQAMLHI